MSLVPGKMMKEGTSVKDTEISRVDQDKINAFSRMNMKAHFIREDIKALKEELDKLEDANTIVEDTFMGMDGDDAISLFVGECFVHANEDQATQYLEKVQEEKQNDLEKKQDELEEVEANMQNLKSYLYARFGSSINLEEGQ